MGTRRGIDESAILTPGEWRHRFVDANGLRFHVAEQGHGPLVLLLHGFLGFWWSWHRQLPALAGAGYRAVAVDLRGCGASDKPPRGYDLATLAADVAALIRALGERDAVIAGHDFGGMLAFTVARTHPRRVRRLVVLSAAHPLRLRAALAVDPRGQLAARRHLLRAQLPGFERALTRADATRVAALLRGWVGPQHADDPGFAAYVRACRDAVQLPQVSACAVRPYRRALRSAVLPSGRKFVKLLQEPISAPTSQLHGACDRAVLPRTAQGSGRYVTSRYEWRVIEAVGHFPQLEAPELVTGEIVRWARE